MHQHHHYPSTAATFCNNSASPPIQQQHQQQHQLPNLAHFQQQREHQQQLQIQQQQQLPLPGAYPHNQNRTPFGQARASLGFYWGSKQLFDTMNQYNTNPVGALQERYQSRGIAPQYRVVQAEGASHCPTFSYEVFVGEHAAIGSGSSKKQAKHNAARAMLDKLDGRMPPQEIVMPLTSSPRVTSNDIVKSETNSSLSAGDVTTTSFAKGNTIGQLQEICVHKGLPLPMYDLAGAEGQPHQRSFTIKVRVGPYSAQGEGTSKKDAKREAAGKMIEIIHEAKITDLPPNEVGDILEEDILKKVGELKIDSLKPEDSVKITHFYQSLKQGKESKLAILNRTKLNNIRGGDFMTILKDIAAEQQFEVTHVEIEEKSEDGDIQCLVQISSLPVAVCYGCGKDRESAEQKAARTALDYLKLMTRGGGGGSKTATAETNNNSQQQHNGKKN